MSNEDGATFYVEYWLLNEKPKGCRAMEVDPASIASARMFVEKEAEREGSDYDILNAHAQTLDYSQNNARFYEAKSGGLVFLQNRPPISLYHTSREGIEKLAHGIGLPFDERKLVLISRAG